MLRKALTVTGVATIAALALTPAAQAAEGGSVAAKRGGCGEIRNPKTSGARAHWELSCRGGRITVSGWVQDTDADGQCARVKAVFASGTTEFSERACPKNVKKYFNWSHPGAIADVYLYEFDV